MPGCLSSRGNVKVLMQKQKNRGYLYIIALLLAGAAAFAVRMMGIEHITADFETCLIPWSAAMKTGRGPGILRAYDGDYNMPYVTVLWLLNYLPGRTIVKVKLFSVLFEYLGAVAAGLIAAHFAGAEKKRLVFTAACIAVWFYPSAVLNGAWWGQCDFIYVAFLLYMIYALLKEHYAAAMILLGCAFSFKLQAVLIMPVLLIFWWKKRSFSGAYFLLTAVMMEVLCIPAILGGYSVFIPFSIYTRQLGRYPYMYVFYPNFWALFKDSPYYIFSNVAILSILAGLGLFAVSVIRKKTEIPEKQWMEFAVWSTFFMMCFLPCMHERYGMLVEVLAIIYAFLDRKSWWNAVVIGSGSFIAYLQVTFGQNILPDQWIAAAYLLSLGFFTWRMIENWNGNGQCAADRACDPKSVGERGRHCGVSSPENRMMDFVDKYILYIAYAALTILAVAVRKPMIECISADYLSNLIEIEGNYHTPLYMFLMQILSFVNSTFLPEKTLFFLVKLLCMAADIFAAAMLAVCVFTFGDGKNAAVLGKKEEGRTDRKLRAVMIYGLMLFLPAVLLNSPFWAHLDSICIGLFAVAYLLYVRKKEIFAGVLAGFACGLLAHYAVALALVSCVRLFAVGKTEAFSEKSGRAKRFENTCVVVMVFSSMTGVFCGYSILQNLVKLLNFWENMGTWMLYPLLILVLVFCFIDKRWIPAGMLLELAVILDWGEFLYEFPVLPHMVYTVLYLAGGIWALSVAWKGKRDRRGVCGGRNGR